MQQDAFPGTYPVKDVARSLKTIHVLNALAPKEIALLGAECEWRSYARDDIIFSAGHGDGLGGVMFVVTGSVRLARSSGPSGRVSFLDVEAGGQFGEMSVFGVSETDLSAVAREATEIATMPEERFTELLAREESVSRMLLCQYARLLRRGIEAVAAPAVDAPPNATGAQRVYAELFSLAEPRVAGDNGCEEGLFVPRLPRHRELAMRLSTSEEVVAGAIADIVKHGIALREYPGLLIKDPAALQALLPAVEA